MSCVPSTVGARVQLGLRKTVQLGARGFLPPDVAFQPGRPIGPAGLPASFPPCGPGSRNQCGRRGGSGGVRVVGSSAPMAICGAALPICSYLNRRHTEIEPGQGVDGWPHRPSPPPAPAVCPGDKQSSTNLVPTQSGNGRDPSQML